MNNRLAHTRSPARFIAGSVAAAVAAVAGFGLATATGNAAPQPSVSHARLVQVGRGPQESVLDPATHTLYVENADQNSVSVIDAATCNARVSSGCLRKPPTIQVGSQPEGIDVDVATNTVYTANANGNDVSVINGATCNAEHISGCSQTPPTVSVGSTPVDLRVNQATNTIYVANYGKEAGTTVSVINGQTCNGRDSSGCSTAPATITIGTGPAGVAVDPVTNTIYAAAVAPNGVETVSVIDGASCDATTTVGCAGKPTAVKIGTGSTQQNVEFAVDRANHTVYVLNFASNTMSMINDATCNGKDAAGCGQTPDLAPTGAGPNGIALNAATHTAYVANIPGNRLSLFDTASCNATTTSGCRTLRSESLRTGRQPEWVSVDESTDTLYVPNGEDNDVSVLNGASCNAVRHVGCAGSR
jgi:DNA-binding beta-propeller fold protein YncE